MSQRNRDLQLPLRKVLTAPSGTLFCQHLLETLAQGDVPVLLPNLQDGTFKKFASCYDEVLPPDSGRIQVAQWDQMVARIKPEQQIIFFTSGSAGEPKKVIRTWGQLTQEIHVLQACFGDNPARLVAATVSAQHIYGFLFRILWPLLTQREMLDQQIAFPEDLAVLDQLGKKYILVTSPAFLKRMATIATPFTNCAVITSSGGKLEKTEADFVSAAFGIYADEIYGSTETSGIACRKQNEMNPEGLWQPFESVCLQTNAQGFLVVESPFISGAQVVTGDLAEIQQDGRFFLKGRGDRIAKIEEKRVSLSEIENELQKIDCVNQAVAFVSENGRQQIFCAIVLSNRGIDTIERYGKHFLNQKIKNSLSKNFDRVLLPRKFRYLTEMPMNEQSKIDHTQLRELFND